jgi:hypothetical protein
MENSPEKSCAAPSGATPAAAQEKKEKNRLWFFVPSIKLTDPFETPRALNIDKMHVLPRRETLNQNSLVSYKLMESLYSENWCLSLP